MELGELRPVLAALVLPPAGPLLLALLGVLLALRRRGAGLALAAVGIVLTMVLATEGIAHLLARHLLPQVQPASAQDLQRVQAIVVLGGGIWPEAPEYGAAQPSESTLVRLRYGARLARQTGKPLAFAGGIGWAAAGNAVPEGVVARRTLLEDYGLTPRWVDERSRDTAQNAQRMAEVATRDGVRRIALVTDALHMPRAVAAFRRAGFEVVPAPTAFPVRSRSAMLAWIPSASGLLLTHRVLHEALGSLAARLN